MILFEIIDSVFQEVSRDCESLINSGVVTPSKSLALYCVVAGSSMPHFSAWRPCACRVAGWRSDACVCVITGIFGAWDGMPHFR